MGRGGKKRKRSGVFALNSPKESSRNTIHKKVEDDGTVKYFDGWGDLHREDGPAETLHGVEKYYWHGEIHREDGPAIINPHTGEKEWYKYGKLHRLDGPARVTAKETWDRIEGRHGVSFANATTEEWYREGKLHREGGPAKIYYDGREEWWVDGEQIDNNFS